MKNQGTLENQVNYAYLALGSNLGKKIKNLELVKYKLCKIGVNIIKTSGFYYTKSWPNSKFPNYINSVLLVKTKLFLPELFKQIKLIEKSLGRTKAPKNYPRICDIDIIDYNGQILNFSCGNLKFIVPHKKMTSRNFVLYPLKEIAPNWVHPKTKVKVSSLINNLADENRKSILKIGKN